MTKQPSFWTATMGPFRAAWRTLVPFPPLAPVGPIGNEDWALAGEVLADSSDADRLAYHEDLRRAIIEFSEEDVDLDHMTVEWASQLALAHALATSPPPYSELTQDELDHASRVAAHASERVSESDSDDARIIFDFGPFTRPFCAGPYVARAPMAPIAYGLGKIPIVAVVVALPLWLYATAFDFVFALPFGCSSGSDRHCGVILRYEPETRVGFDIVDVRASNDVPPPLPALAL